jgi:hypothetical protein
MHLRSQRLTLLGLTLAGLLLTACALPLGSREASPDPFVLFRPHLLPEAQADLDNLKDAPVYHLTMRIDTANRRVTGQARVTVPNASRQEWKEVYFRLYPNLLQYSGIMTVDGVTVDNQAAAFTYDADDTALRLILPSSLAPGRSAVVQLSYTLQAPRRDVGYVLFGEGQGILSLPVAYPVLAVYDEGGWHLDVVPSHADAAFSATSFYVVTATVPAGVVIAPSGAVLTTVAGDDGTVSWHIVSGPAREFALLLSPDYQAASTQAYSTTVTSYFLPADREMGLMALEYAAAIVRAYSDYFGPYPYTYIHIAEAPLTYRGQEYPGLNLLGIDVYRDQRNSLEFLAAHEIAHQWWYNLVNNDPANTPWLDEGLAEYSTFFYYKARFGEGVAETLRARRWVAPVEYAKGRGLDAVVGQPASAFKSNYEAMVYAKAALFFDALRTEVGEPVFLAALREYIRRYRWGIVTPDDLLTSFIAVGGRDVRDLYHRWILSTGSP